MAARACGNAIKEHRVYTVGISRIPISTTNHAQPVFYERPGAIGKVDGYSGCWPSVPHEDTSLSCNLHSSLRQQWLDYTGYRHGSWRSLTVVWTDHLICHHNKTWDWHPQCLSCPEDKISRTPKPISRMPQQRHPSAWGGRCTPMTPTEPWLHTLSPGRACAILGRRLIHLLTWVFMMSSMVGSQHMNRFHWMVDFIYCPFWIRTMMMTHWVH